MRYYCYKVDFHSGCSNTKLIADMQTSELLKLKMLIVQSINIANCPQITNMWMYCVERGKVIHNGNQVSISGIL